MSHDFQIDMMTFDRPNITSDAGWVAPQKRVRFTIEGSVNVSGRSLNEDQVLALVRELQEVLNDV